MKKSELRQLIRECINSSGIRETTDPREVNVFGYQTKHFDVCPTSQGLYLKIVEENLVDNKDLVIQSAKLHDTLFYMEKVALKGGVKVGPRRYQLRVIDPFDPAVAAGARTGLPAYTREQYLAIAQKIAAEIMRLAREMGLEQEHNYIANHVRIIKNALAKLSPGRLPGSFDGTFESKMNENRMAIDDAEMLVSALVSNYRYDIDTADNIIDNLPERDFNIAVQMYDKGNEQDALKYVLSKTTLDEVNYQEGTCGYNTDARTGKKLKTPGGLK